MIGHRRRPRAERAADAQEPSRHPATLDFPTPDRKTARLPIDEENPAQ